MVGVVVRTSPVGLPLRARIATIRVVELCRQGVTDHAFHRGRWTRRHMVIAIGGTIAPVVLHGRVTVETTSMLTATAAVAATEATSTTATSLRRLKMCRSWKFNLRGKTARKH